MGDARVDRLDQPVLPQARRDFARIRVDQTVGEALRQVQNSQIEGQIVYFYVVDEDERLHGVVPARGLLLNPAQTPVADIMIRQVLTLSSTATLLDACEMFILHRLLALPIVDAQRRILGVVDVSLYTDEMIDIVDREASDDVFQLIGVRLAQVRKAPMLTVFRLRFPWLLANIASGLVGAAIIGFYQGVLEQFLVLALFVPVILALAESVSIQSLTLTLQAHHGGKVDWASTRQAIAREIPTGLMLGVGCGLIVAAFASLWSDHLVVLLSMLASIALSVTTAALLGLLVPVVLWAIRRDAKVASGPITLALTDVGTLVYLFGLAWWWLIP